MVLRSMLGSFSEQRKPNPTLISSYCLLVTMQSSATPVTIRSPDTACCLRSRSSPCRNCCPSGLVTEGRVHLPAVRVRDHDLVPSTAWMKALLPPAMTLAVAASSFELAATTPVPITSAMLESELVHVAFKSVTFPDLTVMFSYAEVLLFRNNSPFFTLSQGMDTGIT